MITVTAAIIERDGKILIAQRKQDDYMGGKWEFPGGKVEDGETPEVCLKRELHEEFEADIEVGEFLLSSKYDYGDLAIDLLAYRAKLLSESITPHDHQSYRWVTPSELHNYDFPEADKPIIEIIS